MPVKKLPIKPGVNRENTRYTTEGGWYECDKIRFRQGNPEKIGGWNRYNLDTFEGVCRSLFPWSSFGGERRIGVGTNLKYYIERNSTYNDITPIANTEALAANPFSVVSGSADVTVTDAAATWEVGDYVIFSGATVVGGLDLNGEYRIQSSPSATEYVITADSPANATTTGGGTVTAEYLLSPGPEVSIPTSGYGSGTYGSGTYGSGTAGTETLRIWNNSNFGSDLIIGPKNGAIYYWAAVGGFPSRAVRLDSLPGASDVPLVQRLLLVSDVSRFVFAFGCNELGDTTQDPMLIRWSDQENAANWTPSATNQAGGIRLSRGSEIVAVQQARQEILVWTDTSLYSLQYVGPPEVWSVQLVGENISIASDGAVSYSNGIAYWMGREKFYRYDGRAQPLSCDLRKFVFDGLNEDQYEQVFAGSNEQFHEIWWFYCTGNSEQITNYVVYNYLEDIWYYGTLGRTAWVDAGINNNPIAATYNNTLVEHEIGVDDESTESPQPINAFILSSQFDIDDGHRFMFMRRLIPDVSFEGSTAQSPSVTMSILPLKGSGSGYNNPASVGGESSGTASRLLTVPVEQYTNQLFIRARGRQMSLKIESTGLGVQWQLGYPRIDMRPDGRK